MAYTRINWEDTPSTKTPINAENLNKMDQGIFSAHEQLDAIPDWAKNGVSPKIVVEKIEGGHEIMVTDYTGTQSFEVMDGQNGVYIGSGDMPEDCDVQIDPDGEILDVVTKFVELNNTMNRMGVNITNLQTANQEMEASIEAVEAKIESIGTIEISDYWQTHLDAKIATIKALHRQYGKNCFSFVFMTDIHYPTNLGKRSPLLAKRIMDECNIKFALNGGDNQTRGCYQTKEEILSENKQVAEMFAPIKDRLLQIEGNHDGSYYWNGGSVGSDTSYAKQLTEQGMFEEYYRGNGLSGDAHFDKNSNAFYVDDVSNKVRYIGLNSMNVPNSKDDVNADGTAKYCKFRSYQFLQAQYDFLCNEAIVTVPSDEWRVVVFGHSGIYNSGDYTVMVDVLSAYKDKKPCVAEYAGVAAGGAAYTNLADPESADWKVNHRISSSGITTSSGEGKTVCNQIPITPGDVIRIKGVSFVPNVDRYALYKQTAFGVADYISNITGTSGIKYTLDNDVHKFEITVGAEFTHFCVAFTTPTDPYSVIITKNEEIVEAEHGYDYVSVNHDFTEAKGEFVAYFHGHDHQDMDYTRDSIKDISTRCDGNEENDETLNAERVVGTITEQSFDVFTITPDKIYATKIGAGSDRVISY